MINETLWFLLMLVNLSGIILAYRFFGKVGLYAWVAMAIILANIQVAKIIRFFGLITAMGNIIYSTTFLATDILTEKHGVKEARKAVFIGFFTLIMTTLIMQITLAFIPDESDTLSPALEQIFGFMPDVMIASLTAYLISQLHDVWAFEFWKRKTKGKHLWLRNNASTMVSQLIDNITFTTLFFVVFNPQFVQSLGLQGIFEIFITSYVMKFIVAVFDTPFIYLSKRIDVN
ncbi:VUT family protein [Archaeoglobales archaeon]|nr:MAG: VUT family protein [Archaeoglobales archaeon]